MDNQSQRIDTEQMENRKKFLSTIAPFQFLPKNEIITIVAKLTSQTHKKGSTLFLQEETAIDHILIVRSGRLERTIEEGGRKFVKATLEPGDIYGGISFLFNNCISTSTVRCIEEASVYNLDCEIFVRLCIEYPEFGLHFSRIIDQGKKRISSAASIETDRFEKEYLADSFLWKTIGDIVRAIPSCPIGTSIKQAAELLTASNRSAILILDEDSRPRGIVTDYDLRKKVIVDGRSPSDAVETIMSTHLIQLDVRSPVFEAVLTMMQNRVNHLAVSRDSRIEGIITERDLSHAGAHSPVLLAHEIQNARGLDELKKAYIKLPRMIQNVFLNGARASYLNSIITTITDAVLAKAVESAVKVLGPAPSQFAFLLFGSEGRKEQTLKTDQDNAIVYEDPAGKDEQKINEYFLNLGKYVCDRLDEIGQKHCKFEIMAKNPMWCQPLSNWKAYYRRWIISDDSDRILKASIFFDLRLGYGSQKLVDSLHAALFENLAKWPGILTHLARNTMNYRPPLGFFGNFILQEQEKAKEILNIKNAMRLIVDFGRIYAIKSNLVETNTLRRLQAIYRQDRMNEALGDIMHAYEFLMYQRLKHQSQSMRENGGQPNNFIRPADLTTLDQQTLKEAFRQIRIAQAKLKMDFFLFFP